jgi:hypothetical protein
MMEFTTVKCRTIVELMTPIAEDRAADAMEFYRDYSIGSGRDGVLPRLSRRIEL